MKMYMVGGYVRDELLGVKSKDIDYAVEASSYQEMVDWIMANGKIFQENPEHLTVRAHIKGKQPSDFVLCRKDGAYSDGRRPDTVTPGTLFDDLQRCDFTVNAIAKDEEGNYIDPFNGQEDLKTMTLKCVGVPFERFNEDALRVLRAMRFHLTRGFRIDIETKTAMWNRVVLDKLKNKISVERKQDELTKCMAHDSIATMGFLATMGLEFTQAIFTNGLWLMPTTKKA